MISSGALPNVALRKPPMPGPVCTAACSVASPMSQASGNQRQRREDELHRLREIRHVVEGDRDRGEGESREEDLPDHGRGTLPAPSPEERGRASPGTPLVRAGNAPGVATA